MLSSKLNIYIIAFTYSGIALISLLYALGTDNYASLFLVPSILIFIWLFYINKTALVLLIIISRMVLDSMPQITYADLFASLSVMEFFTFAVMAFMLVYLIVYDGIIFDGIIKSMLFLLGTMCLTTIYHGNYGELIQIGSRWLYFILVYMFFKLIQKDVPFKKILIIMAFASLYPFFNQMYSVAIGEGQAHLDIFTRFAGTYHHVHTVADYLFFAIPAALYLYIVEKRSSQKNIYLGLIGLYHIGIFFAGYRTNWIAVFVFWCCYITFVSRKKIVSATWITILILFSWNLVGDVLVGNLNPLITILKNPDPLFSFDNCQYNDLLSGRIGIWSLSLEQYFHSGIGEKIFGLGLGYTDKYLHHYMHNDYISALVETGISGLFLLILWILTTIKSVYDKKQFNREYTFIVLSTFLSFLIIAFGTMPFRHIVVLNYIAIYLSSIGQTDTAAINSKT